MWWSKDKRKTRPIATGIVLALSLSLAGCGFQPLYGKAGPGSSIDPRFTSIVVEVPPTDIGGLLEQQVLDLISAHGVNPENPSYRLTLTPRAVDSAVAVEEDTEVTRRNFVVQTGFSLIDSETGEAIYSSTSRSQASYNRVSSEYANIIAARDAARRTTRAVAEDIRLKLAAFFAMEDYSN